MIPSIPDQASSIRCHCIFFLPIYIKVDVACIIACSAYAPQLPCHFFCPQSVKERFLGASVSESECKGTTFFRFRKNFDDYFSRKCENNSKTGEMSVFKGNNRQPERTEVRFSGASKEQRRRAQKAQTLKRSSENGEAPEFRRIGRGIKQEKQGAPCFSHIIYKV